MQVHKLAEAVSELAVQGEKNSGFCMQNHAGVHGHFLRNSRFFWGFLRGFFAGLLRLSSQDILALFG